MVLSLSAIGDIRLSERLHLQTFGSTPVRRRFCFTSSEGGSPYNDDSPPNLLRREVIHMISWVELIALLSLIVLIVDLVVSVNNGNKKN